MTSDFLVALSVYSRIPVPLTKVSPTQIANASAYLPLVGAVLCLPLAAVYTGATQYLNSPLSIALTLAAYLVLTGG